MGQGGRQRAGVNWAAMCPARVRCAVCAVSVRCVRFECLLRLGMRPSVGPAPSNPQPAGPEQARTGLSGPCRGQQLPTFTACELSVTRSCTAKLVGARSEGAHLAACSRGAVALHRVGGAGEPKGRGRHPPAGDGCSRVTASRASVSRATWRRRRKRPRRGRSRLKAQCRTSWPARFATS